MSGSFKAAYKKPLVEDTPIAEAIKTQAGSDVQQLVESSCSIYSMLQQPVLTSEMQNLSLDDSDNTSPKVAKEKFSTPSKYGKRVAKRMEKATVEKLKPSDDELRDIIHAILKEVDFNVATFTDILKLLALHFGTDLTPRKSSIKLIIHEELTKLGDEADDEDGEGNAEKDENQSAEMECDCLKIV